MSKASRRAKQPTPVVAAPAQDERASSLYAALCLAVIACALYLPSWSHGFVLDDAFVVAKNEWTKQGVAALPQVVTHSLYFGAVPQNSDLYRPAAGAYFVIVGALVGIHPVGYHIANILLYGLSAALVFLFFTRLTPRSIALPFVAALVFVAHPIHAEVVNNVKSADEMLCLVFFLASAIAWLEYADTSQPRWRWIGLAAFTVAVFSKETAVPLVVILPALWYFFRQRTVRASLTAAAPFFLVAAAYVVARFVAFSREPITNTVTIDNNALVVATDAATRLASAFGYLAKYAQMLVWPYPQSSDYTYNAIPLRTFADPVAWVGVALCVGLGAIFVVGFRKRQPESFAALWMAASMIIVSNLVFLISTNFGERLMFAPSVIVCYAAARLLFKAARLGQDQPLSAALRAPVVVAPLLVVLPAAVIVVLNRMPDWRDEMTLFTADVAKYPDSVRLNSYLSHMHYIAGDKLLGQQADASAAAADFQQAKAYALQSLKVRNAFSEYNAVLGLAEYQLHQCREAIPNLQQAATFDIYRATALPMTAACYEELQMPAEALAMFKQIDAAGIPYAHGWFQLGNDAAAHGDDDASIAYFRKVLGATPDNASAYANIAAAQHRKGDYPASLDSAKQCIALQPTLAQCLIVAADDLMRTGHADEARAYLARAQAIK